MNHRSRILDIVEIYSTEQLSLVFVLHDHREEFITGLISEVAKPQLFFTSDLLTFLNDSRLSLSYIKLKLCRTIFYQNSDLFRAYWEPRLNAIEESSNFQVLLNDFCYESVDYALIRK